LKTYLKNKAKIPKGTNKQKDMPNVEIKKQFQQVTKAKKR
jgi:hypothetical protein